MLSLCQALPCFTAPSFDKRILIVTWTHVVKSFLHEVKNLHTAVGRRQTRSLVTVLPIANQRLWLLQGTSLLGSGDQVGAGMDLLSSVPL